jgi:anti-anti-sigma factor
MEIARIQRENYLELSVEGRMDGYWAQHVATSVGEVLREGTHAVRINLSKTAYISSAGIGVLVDLYKQFQAVNGSFVVIEPSRAVERILQMVGLAPMLTGGGAPLATPAAPKEFVRREQGGMVLEIHELAPGAQLTCRVVGRPERLAGAGFSAEDCHALAVTPQVLALGLGAFGEGFDGCRDRCGEFLCVAGGAACQPTDGTNFPDYMLASGTFVPHLTALYGLCCEGEFSTLVRFESVTANDPLALSLILQACLEISGAQTAGIVMLAESAGLMGATLKRPPVQPGRLFAYPEIRQWLSFSPERSFRHSLALIAGVASSAPPAELRPLVRPLAGPATAAGHFHAAAFGYRPLQKGKVEIQSTVTSLFAAGGLQGVVHLLADDREIVREIAREMAGGGESEVLRGACWVSPVSEVSRQEVAA